MNIYVLSENGRLGRKIEKVWQKLNLKLKFMLELTVLPILVIRMYD